jgi:hypothetical protein
MSRLATSFALLVLSLVVLVPASVEAEGRIAVYFDEQGTERVGYPKNEFGPGLDLIYIFGEGFEASYITGVQYQIDYGPHMTWLGDVGAPPITIGNSRDGVSMGFGIYPRTGGKFLIHKAFVQWNGDCTQSFNGDVVSDKHPLFSNSTPIVTRYPDQAVVSAGTLRSQSCQLVEVDLTPAVCPNYLPVSAWNAEWHTSSVDVLPFKGGLVALAILGRDDLDVSQLDASSIMLAGRRPLIAPGGPLSINDFGVADGMNTCACDPGAPAATTPEELSQMDKDEMLEIISRSAEKDGKQDMILFFRQRDIALAIAAAAPEVGEEVQVSITGEYTDGLPFNAFGCFTIADHGQSMRGNVSGATMGQPTPNPFNPVNRISYTVPMTQRVRISVYDVAGRLVENLVNETKGAGEYVVEWDAGNLPSGVYFYRMQTGERTIVRRATLLK